MSEKNSPAQIKERQVKIREDFLDANPEYRGATCEALMDLINKSDAKRRAEGYWYVARNEAIRAKREEESAQRDLDVALSALARARQECLR